MFLNIFAIFTTQAKGISIAIAGGKLDRPIPDRASGLLDIGKGGSWVLNQSINPGIVKFLKSFLAIFK